MIFILVLAGGAVSVALELLVSHALHYVFVVLVCSYHRRGNQSLYGNDGNNDLGTCLPHRQLTHIECQLVVCVLYTSTLTQVIVKVITSKAKVVNGFE